MATNTQHGTGTYPMYSLLSSVAEGKSLNPDDSIVPKPSHRQWYGSIRIAIALFIAFFVLCAPAKGVELMLLQVEDAAVEMDQLKFIDARPLKVWQRGHIPKARSFSWETYTHTDVDGVKYRTLPPEALADALGKMGISHNDAVAVYGDADTSWGGEGWVAWVFAWLGHRGPVYILDGGFSLWQSKGYPVEKNETTDFPVANYRIDLQPDRNISAVEIADAGNSITLVDTRNYFSEWLPGHLPDAVHIPWEKFYYGDHRRFLSTDALRRMLIEKGVDPAKPVVYYCTGGIRSGFTWVVHELAGLGNAKNFEGGTAEWYQMIENR